MLVPRLVLAAPAFLVAAPLASASIQQPPVDPLRFFQGRTETDGTVKVIFHKAYATRSLGEGKIEADGSLLLVQRVFDEGKPPAERRWLVRRTGPDRYAGTMSEAVGPVTIDKAGDSYRFRFRLKGDMNAEELLTPLPGGRSARNRLKVTKMGITVATTDGTVRKL